MASVKSLTADSNSAQDLDCVRPRIHSACFLVGFGDEGDPLPVGKDPKPSSTARGVDGVDPAVRPVGEVGPVDGELGSELRFAPRVEMGSGTTCLGAATAPCSVAVPGASGAAPLPEGVVGGAPAPRASATAPGPRRADRAQGDDQRLRCRARASAKTSSQGRPRGVASRGVEGAATISGGEDVGGGSRMSGDRRSAGGVRRQHARPARSSCDPTDRAESGVLVAGPAGHTSGGESGRSCWGQVELGATCRRCGPALVFMAQTESSGSASRPEGVIDGDPDSTASASTPGPWRADGLQGGDQRPDGEDDPGSACGAASGNPPDAAAELVACTAGASGGEAARAAGGDAWEPGTRPGRDQLPPGEMFKVAARLLKEATCPGAGPVTG